MAYPPSLVIDPEETIARRIILDLVEGDLKPDLVVQFPGLDLRNYTIKMNVRHEDLKSFSRTVNPESTAGYIVDENAWPMPDQDGKSVIMSIDGGLDQTVTFEGETTEIEQAAIQLQFGGAHTTEDGMNITITSASFGEGSTVEYKGGTSDLNWGTPVDGTGDLDTGTVVWQSGDLIEGTHQIEFEFTSGGGTFTLPRRYPITLRVRRDLG